MNFFSRWIYRLGGYDYKIIEKIAPLTTHYSIKYSIPGISLLIVFFTAGFGGWHFTATMMDTRSTFYPLWHILATFSFASFIFFIDYLILNSGNSRVVFIARIILSLGLGSIVAILTTLAFFSDEITAELTTRNNDRIRVVEQRYSSQLQGYESKIRALEDSMRVNRDLSVKEIQGRTASRTPGAGPAFRQIRQNLRDDSVQLAGLNADLRNKKTVLEDERKVEVDRIRNEYANDFLAQSKSLWRLMGNGIVAIYSVIFLITLIVCDLIPLIAKVMKEYSKDKDPYKKIVGEMDDALENSKSKIEYMYSNGAYLELEGNYRYKQFREKAITELKILQALEKFQLLKEDFASSGIPEKVFDRTYNKLESTAAELGVDTSDIQKAAAAEGRNLPSDQLKGKASDLPTETAGNLKGQTNDKEAGAEAKPKKDNTGADTKTTDS